MTQEPTAHYETDPARFVETYTPPKYASFDASRAGRWSSLPGTLGVLWTDDEDGLGAIAMEGDDDADQFSILMQLISDYKAMNAPASAAFNALRTIYDGEEPVAGTLSEIPAPDPLIAAADPESEPDPATPADPAPAPAVGDETFAAFSDDKFVGVGMARVDGVYIRDGGAWQKLPDTNLLFDDTEWLPLDDAGVAKYDEAEKNGTELTRADVEGQAPRS